MNKTAYQTLAVTLLSLAAISCSSVVAEYTYRGSVTGTGNKTSSRTLVLKEYKDGYVSGELMINSAYADPYSCGAIGGKVVGKNIQFYRTDLGDSYLAATLASVGQCTSANARVKYNGRINNNRRYLSGTWYASNEYRSCVCCGKFNFNITHINGRPVIKRPITDPGPTNKPIGAGGFTPENSDTTTNGPIGGGGFTPENNDTTTNGPIGAKGFTGSSE